jgi:uncharacterized integral membrane protein (TIGR00697 family)
MINLEAVITLFNSWPIELVSCLEILSCLLVMAGVLRCYGLYGLYGFISILVVVGNIQVLKGGQFGFLPHPVALGTVLFGIIAVSFDIITEYYGKQAALKGVQLSFIIFAFFTWLMFLTTGLKPLDSKILLPDEAGFYFNHLHIKALFIPMPEILVASLAAYFTSQYVDVLIYFSIKHITQQRLLWLRAVLSTGVSAFIDTCIFSLLAWKVLSPHPVSWHTLWTDYIFQTYPLRLACSFCFSPLVYLARYCLPPKPYEYLSKL